MAVGDARALGQELRVGLQGVVRGRVAEVAKGGGLGVGRWGWFRARVGGPSSSFSNAYDSLKMVDTRTGKAACWGWPRRAA